MSVVVRICERFAVRTVVVKGSQIVIVTGQIRRDVKVVMTSL